MHDNQVIVLSCRVCGWGTALAAVLWGFHGSAMASGLCLVAAAGLLFVGRAHRDAARQEIPMF